MTADDHPPADPSRRVGPGFDTLDERHFRPAPATAPLRRVPLSALAGGKRAAPGAPRILFEEDFANPRPRARPATPPPEAPPPPPSFSAAELEDARRAAFRDGRDAGRMAARAEAEAAGQAALGAIAAALGQAAAECRAARENTAEGAARLMLGMLQTLHPSLSPALAGDDIACMVETLLPQLTAEPRLALRLCPPLVETLAPRIRELAAAAGFQGELLFRPDPTIPPDGAALTWSAGAALRDPPALRAALLDALAPLGLSPIPPEASPDA